MKLEADHMQVDAVALVDRPANGVNFHFTKAAHGSGSFRVFFPFEISKSTATGAPCRITGVAYPCNGPGHPDKQGDWTDLAGTKAMARSWDSQGRLLNLQHRPPTLTKEQARTDSSIITANGNWALVVTVLDPQIAEAVRSGVFKGFSIEGRCTVPATKATSEHEMELATMNKSEYEDSVETLAELKRLVELIALLPDGPPSEAEQAQIIQQKLAEQALVLRGPEAPTATVAPPPGKAVWSGAGAVDLGRALNPRAAQEADDAERRLKERQQEIREAKRYAAAREAAREARHGD